MPIDFTQIESGEDFELLCEALLRAMGFTIVEKVARGPDQGKDIIASKLVTDELDFTGMHRFLIECKHHAKGGKSVLERELGSPIGRMSKHNCDRYILATSTLASEKVQGQLDSLSNAIPHYQATVWHAGDLTRYLDVHPDVRERYFPTESEPTILASQLATIVEGLLKAMGFVYQDSHQIDPLRVGIPFESSNPFPQRMLVVCKGGPIERLDVDDLLAQAQDFDRTFLVTHTRVTPAARDRAAETAGAVRAFALDQFYQFYRELIDFAPYVNQIIARRRLEERQVSIREKERPLRSPIHSDLVVDYVRETISAGLDPEQLPENNLGAILERSVRQVVERDCRDLLIEYGQVPSTEEVCRLLSYLGWYMFNEGITGCRAQDAAVVVGEAIDELHIDQYSSEQVLDWLAATYWLRKTTGGIFEFRDSYIASVFVAMELKQWFAKGLGSVFLPGRTGGPGHNLADEPDRWQQVIVPLAGMLPQDQAVELLEFLLGEGMVQLAGWCIAEGQPMPQPIVARAIHALLDQLTEAELQ